MTRTAAEAMKAMIASVTVELSAAGRGANEAVSTSSFIAAHCRRKEEGCGAVAWRLHVLLLQTWREAAIVSEYLSTRVPLTFRELPSATVMAP